MKAGQHPSDLLIRSNANWPVASPSLTANQIEQIFSGKGDTSTIDVLIENQYIKSINNLLTIANSLTSPAVETAMSLLEKAKQLNGDAFKETLTYPHISLSLAVHARQIKRSSPHQKDEILSRLSAIAAAAALNCKIKNFCIEVAVDYGKIIIPATGKADLGVSTDKFATLECNNGAALLRTDNATVPLPSDASLSTYEWQPIRSCVFQENGLTLRLKVDDIDPWRGLHTLITSIPPDDRLDPIHLKHLTESISQAWQLLTRDHYEYAVGIARGVTMITPFKALSFHSTASYRDGFGGLASTIENEPTRFAQGLLEEFQKMKLIGLNSIKRLHSRNRYNPEYIVPYSPGPVSFSSIIETFYSSATIADFWQSTLKNEMGSKQTEAYVDYALRLHLMETLASMLLTSNALTELGIRLINNTIQRNHSFKTVVPEPIKKLVHYISVDQYVSNRLTNVKPDESDIQRLSSAWLSGEACPTDYPVHEHLQPVDKIVVGRKKRRLLAELYEHHPDTFNELLENRHFLEIVIPGAAIPDAYLAAGKLDTAIGRYISSIQENPQDLEAWAGLSAASVLTENSLAPTLGSFPEIVAALYIDVFNKTARKESIYEIASWIQPLLTEMAKIDTDEQFVHITFGHAHE